jgi:hypothetical protein
MQSILIKIITSLVLIIGAYFYREHLLSYKVKYETERDLRIEANKTIKADREFRLVLEQETRDLEDKLNVISKENANYLECVANYNCYISLRQPQTNQIPAANGTSRSCSSVNETQERIEPAIQQDIFNLRASIEKDELIIVKLQDYVIKAKAHVTKYCGIK